MADVLIYYAGAIGILLVLTAVAYFTAWAFRFASESACRQIVRYRRLSWLRYWAARLEAEGLLPLDEHYRAIAKEHPPQTAEDALRLEQQLASNEWKEHQAQGSAQENAQA